MQQLPSTTGAQQNSELLSTAHPRRLGILHLVMIVLAASCAIGSAVLVLAASNTSPDESYRLHLFSLAFSSIAIIVAGAGIKLDLFHPASVIALLFFVVFGLGSIRHFESGSPNAGQIVFFANIGVWSFAISNWLLSSGVHFRTTPPKMNDVAILTLLRIYLWCLVGAAAMATAFIYVKVGIPALSENGLVSRLAARQEVTSYIVYLARISQFAVYFFFVLALATRERSMYILAFILFAFVLAINLTMGWRGPAFFILITLVFIFNYATARKHTLLVAALISTTVLGALIWGYLRLVVYSTSTEIGALTFIQATSSDSLSMFLHWGSLQFSNYVAGFQQVIALTEANPDIFDATVFQYTLSTLLPGQQMSFDQALKLLSYNTFEGDGLNATLLGEAYADFGSLGIALYCAGFGALSGLTYKRVCDRQSHFRLIEHGFVMSVLILGTLTGIFGQAIYWVLAFTLLGARLTHRLGMQQTDRVSSLARRT